MRFRRDIHDDEEELFGADEARRIREEREHRHNEALRQIEESNRIEAELEALRDKRRDDIARAGTERMLIDGYLLHGVQPLKVTADGIPTCSIDVLFSLGWTIGTNEIMEKVLVRPAHIGLPPEQTEGT